MPGSRFMQRVRFSAKPREQCAVASVERVQELVAHRPRSTKPVGGDHCAARLYSLASEPCRENQALRPTETRPSTTVNVGDRSRSVCSALLDRAIRALEMKQTMRNLRGTKETSPSWVFHSR